VLHLNSEQDRLVNVTDAISARLAYFQELERATRMLNHPGEDLVLQPDFLIMVERVDICLEYLQNHVRALSAFQILHSHLLEEGLSRSRYLYSTFPTMLDTGDESHQNILHRLYSIARS
jgi:Sec34-like family